VNLTVEKVFGNCCKEGVIQICYTECPDGVLDHRSAVTSFQMCQDQISDVDYRYKQLMERSLSIGNHARDQEVAVKNIWTKNRQGFDGERISLQANITHFGVFRELSNFSVCTQP
jgi:hypothetical protein